MVGALIGAVAGLYGLKQQDERRNKREDDKKAALDKRRKESAYRQLKAHIDGITALGPPMATQYSIRSEQLDAMNSLIIQNFDVLDESTRGAWDTKGVSYSSTPPWVTLTFPAFVKDINDHYEEIRCKAIPTKSPSA
jgi:hypothetical protein